MNKNLILRIVGIVSTLIFIMGALFPFVSVEFFGNKMSKSLIDTSDWIFVMLNAALIIISLFMSEEIPLYICAVSSVLITIAECQAFLGGAMSQLSDVVNKGAGFYFLIIGAVLIIASAVANWFVLHKSNKSSKGSAIPDTRKCPFCAETIKSEAVLCRFCGNKVEPLTKSDTQIISEVDEPKKPVKTGKRRALSVILIVVSALVAVIVLIGIIYNGIDQPSNSHGNSQTSSSYFQPDSEEVYSSTPETTASTTATTTTPATTTTVTTTTAATEPEPEESEYDFELVYYLVQNNFEMVEPDIKSYVAIFDDGTFIYGSSDYYKITEYYGTWEPVRGPMGYETMLCTIEANENQVSYPYGTYQFTLSMSADDPQTAHFSITGDYNSDIFVYNHDGDTFMNIS